MKYDISRLVKKIRDHMGWDKQKTLLWFSTKNPMLGNVSPEVMIFLGRIDKLEKWIDAMIDENTPENNKEGESK